MSLKQQLNDWYPVLSDIIESDEFKELGKVLAQEYKTRKIYPEGSNIFRAFSLCKFSDLKVVIIGQDPYHNGMANGLAFANNEETLTMSPSLLNIRKELEADYDTVILDFDITLESWAKQGVLLINTALTVPEGEPLGHALLWKKTTAAIIDRIIQKTSNTVFILWGKHAQSYQTRDMVMEHEVLISAHPSPFSASMFFGCKHFTKTNEILKEHGRETIQWFSHQDS
jgi:uracil-DNA glycosylase